MNPLVGEEINDVVWFKPFQNDDDWLVNGDGDAMAENADLYYLKLLFI